MYPQVSPSFSLVLTLLAILLRVYHNDAAPSSAMRDEVDYGNNLNEISPYQDNDDDIGFQDIREGPDIDKRFFPSHGIRYPVLYRKGRIPIRIMSKKALGLFTRWRGRETVPYSDGSVLQDMGSNDALGARDIVSAVSRGGSVNGRPLGQPLRWGK